MKPKKPTVTKFVIRYESPDDYATVQQAAAADGRSINNWLVKLSTAAARRKLRRQAALAKPKAA